MATVCPGPWSSSAAARPLWDVVLPISGEDAKKLSIEIDAEFCFFTSGLKHVTLLVCT